jgi:hypothetical protein
MPMTEKDLKGCWLVWYPVSVSGGCTYTQTDRIETREKRDTKVKEEAEWKAKKVVDDVKEYKAANALRNRAKRWIRSLGAPAAPGIVLVPLERGVDLDERREEMTERVTQFNADSVYSKVSFRCYKYPIAGENEQLLADMLGQLRVTLEELRQAEKAADVKGMKSVLDRLAGFDTVLPEGAADYLQRAIADAKAQVKSVEKSLKDKSKTLEQVRTEMNTTQVDFARFAVMQPGDTLDEVDNNLVAKLMAAQANERAAAIDMGDEDDGDNGDDGSTPDFAAIANAGGM